ADRSQRLAALDDELAAAEAALAALREERDGQARAVAEAEVAERDAADWVAAAAAGEEAARAALADHRD
ncbi:MAG: secretion protein HlyD, partial [Microthrixaceae bacterium]|nr:secretion protein HlyD [Microthrixaceae bacterium]